MSWDQIKGNNQNKEFLKNVILNNRLAHAYLFCGPQGVGKSLFAKNFAKAIVCLAKAGDACETCSNCLKIDANNHPDIYNIAPDSATSAIKISDIRQLQSKIYLKPYEAGYRIFIIDDAQNLNEEASNALLKVLEEPPDRSVLILVSTSLERLLPTIVSRCHVVKFSVLGIGQVEEILEKEHRLAKEKAHYLASMAQGRLGSAVSLIDTDVLERRDFVLDWFLGRNKQDDFELETAGKDKQKGALDVICSFYRDVLFYKIDKESKMIMNIDRKKDIEHWADKLSIVKIERSIESIFNINNALMANVNPKVAVPVLMSQLARA